MSKPHEAAVMLALAASMSSAPRSGWTGPNFTPGTKGKKKRKAKRKAQRKARATTRRNRK